MIPHKVLEKENKKLTGIDSHRQRPSISTAFVSAMIIGIGVVIVLIQIGFYPSYVSHFPKFEDYTVNGPGGSSRAVTFNWMIHLHGIFMMGWMFILLVQPVLIRKGKLKLHRQVGRLSYVLAPLVLLSMFLVLRFSYHKNLEILGPSPAVSLLALSVPNILFFAILYSLAIRYRQQTALHMRFMCSTVFLFVTPALGRALKNYLLEGQPGFGLGISILLSFVGIIVIIDSMRTRRLSPFTLVFGFLLIHKILWDLRTTELWQSIGKVIAKTFF